MTQAQLEQSSHCDQVQVGLDVPLDLEECEYSLSSGSSTTSFNDDEDDDHTLSESANSSPVHARQVFTFGHCQQEAPTVGVQPVVIQLVISQPPQNIQEIIQKIVSPLGFIEVDSAISVISKLPKPSSLYEIFENPWDPKASVDEAFSRKAAQVWRRDFGAINPTLAEGPVEPENENAVFPEDSQEKGGREEASLPSVTPDDERSYIDAILQNFTTIPAILFSDPRSPEILESWSTDKQDSSAKKSLPLCVKVCLWACVFLLVYFVMACYFPGVVSRAIVASLGYEIYEPFYYRWVRVILTGFHTVSVGLLYVQSLIIFPFKVIPFRVI